MRRRRPAQCERLAAHLRRYYRAALDRGDCLRLRRWRLLLFRLMGE